MAKQKTSVQVATASVAQIKTDANRDARLARHLKKHPNDVQALSAKGKQKTPRKASKVKGNFPSKKYFYLDGASQKVMFIMSHTEKENEAKKLRSKTRQK